MDASRANPIMRLDAVNLPEEVVLRWFQGFKGREGLVPSESVLGVAKCAIKRLFEKHGEVVPARLFLEMKQVTRE